MSESPNPKRRPLRLLQSLVGVAAGLLLVLALVRAGGLVGDGWHPTATGEARWFGWAWGTVAERALVPDRHHAASRGLPADGALVFTVPADGARPSWVHVMAQYALPHRVVAGVRAGEVGEVPAGATVLALESPDLAEVGRGSASARPGGEVAAARLVPQRPSRARRLAELAALAAGCALVLVAGLFLLGSLAPRRSASTGEVPVGRAAGWAMVARDLPLALPVGLSLAVPLGAVAALLGGSVWIGTLAAAPLAYVLGRGMTGTGWTSSSAAVVASDAPAAPAAAAPAAVAAAPPTTVAPPTRWWPAGRLERAVLVLLALLLALFAARTALAPLWSWDHFAIWGMKARRIHAVGLGAHTFAGPEGAYAYANGHYPLGVPLAWNLLALGAAPAGWLFRAAHVLFGGALALLVRRAAGALGAAPVAATLAAALVVASPLFWDTEALGLAEMALALWAVAAVAAAFDRGRPPAARAGTAGLLLGFLCWVKQDGLVLAVLLAAALGATLWTEAARRSRSPRGSTAEPAEGRVGVLPAGRGGGAPEEKRGIVDPVAVRGARRSALLVRLAVPLVTLALAAAALSWAVPAPGLSFFAGDPVGRALDRLPEAAAILRLLAADLVAGDFLGGWLLFAVAAGVTVARRRLLPALLAAVVVLQLAAYAGVYFATYLDPAAHVASSFFRIAAGLVPLALVAAAGALAESPAAGRARRRTRRPGPAAAPRPS